MPHVVWSRTALADLDRVLDFLEEAGSCAVTDVREAIRKDTQKLIAFPNLGRKVQGLYTNVRESFVRFGRNGYVLRYQVEADRIVIANLRHSREGGYQGRLAQ